MIPERIVGEVSVNWSEDGPQPQALISQRFEEMIATNVKRGYELESWQLHRVAPQLNGITMHVNESIVAVFVRRT